MRSFLPAVLLLAACATAPVVPDPAPTPAPAAEPATVVYVVRHAEKASDGDDPPLTERGQARAEALAALLADQALSAVYSTPYQRTRQTVAPAAAVHGLTVTAYDPSGDLAATLRAAPAGLVFLVAGHSNTVPGIVAGLGAPAQPEIPHEHYGDLYRVTLGDEVVELDISRFGD
jgi:hypothetical protein